MHLGVYDQASKGTLASVVSPRVAVPYSLEQRLERFDRHTRHCRHCKETLAELGVLEERCVTFSNAMLSVGGRDIPGVVYRV
jgi:hypothetical protein